MRGSSRTIAGWTTQIACSASTNSPTISGCRPRLSMAGAIGERGHGDSGWGGIYVTGGPMFKAGSRNSLTSRISDKCGAANDPDRDG